MVLAIAGLIFLMVFVALPALQAGQRDTARKNDASIALSAVNTYISGNRGAFPTTAQLTGTTAAGTPHAATFMKPDLFVKNVSSNTEAVRVNTTTGAQTLGVNVGEVVVTQKTTCGSTGSGTTTANQTLLAGTVNQYTVTTYLEGGNGVSYCAQS